MDKIDSTTVYGNGRTNHGGDVIYKTTNKGITWDSVSISTNNGYASISFVNRDTGWVTGVEGDSLTIWRTTNGGVTLVPQKRNMGDGNLFFLKQSIGGNYYGWIAEKGEGIYRTTNGGINWTLMSNVIGTIYFLNQDTGWRTFGGEMFKTTNSGANWINQPLPSGNQILNRTIERFDVVNSNVIYGVGGNRFLGPGQFKGIIWKTTNGGDVWGFQQPDTSISIGLYNVIDFIDTNTGWAYNSSGMYGAFTNVGAGPITNITKEITSVNTDNYELKQNYPNPFNPSTKISFSIPQSNFVKLKVYNVLGKEVAVLVNENLARGTNEYAFNGTNLASGMYFYKIETNSYAQTKKMLLLK
ncbi:MAG TPA: T9SS type A sorting domain-containing protein [Ignavibacteria bacterium]|nr:T9SS type A sorting domain-containing protein [Ignavibacteria bacterium]